MKVIKYEAHEDGFNIHVEWDNGEGMGDEQPVIDAINHRAENSADQTAANDLEWRLARALENIEQFRIDQAAKQKCIDALENECRGLKILEVEYHRTIKSEKAKVVELERRLVEAGKAMSGMVPRPPQLTIETDGSTSKSDRERARYAAAHPSPPWVDGSPVPPRGIPGHDPSRLARPDGGMKPCSCANPRAWSTDADGSVICRCGGIIVGNDAPPEGNGGLDG